MNQDPIAYRKICSVGLSRKHEINPPGGRYCNQTRAMNFGDAHGYAIYVMGFELALEEIRPSQTFQCICFVDHVSARWARVADIEYTFWKNEFSELRQTARS